MSRASHVSREVSVGSSDRAGPRLGPFFVVRYKEYKMAKGEVFRKVDIIWNITLICPWDCDVCCVDAVHVAKRNGRIQIRSSSLTTTDTLAPLPGSGTIYDQAMKLRQSTGLELSFDQKIQVLGNLEGFVPKIDFSGGDPLAASENLEVMKRASSKFGREQVTLTATGAGLARCDPAEIAPLIGELNFTYDSPHHGGNANRPVGYAAGNLRKAAQFVKYGVSTRGECPLSTYNSGDDELRRLYVNLHDAGVRKLLLMRLFPVGRGVFQSADIPTPEQYRRAIAVLRDMEAKYGSPTLKLQCALKFFDNSHQQENPCDLVRESFGLMSNGTLLASPWAVNAKGHPLDESWVLGNLAENSLENILNSPKSREYARRLDQNFGHCKIFSFLYSKRKRALDRVFDKTDPLYSSQSEARVKGSPTIGEDGKRDGMARTVSLPVIKD